MILPDTLLPLDDNQVHALAPSGVSLLRSPKPGELTPRPGLYFTSPQHPIWHFYLGRDEVEGGLVAAAHTGQHDRFTLYFGDHESIRFFLRAMFRSRVA